MKKLLILLSTLLILSACSNKQIDDRPLVVTSVFPIYDLTQSLAKDTVNVRNIAPLSMEVHDFEPSAQDIIMLQEADLLIVHGNHLEGWLESSLKVIDNPDLKVLELSDDVELLDGDVHTWLSLDIMMHYADRIEQALSQVDSNHALLYKEAKEAWITDAQAFKEDYADLYNNSIERPLVVDHMAFGYLAQDLNLKQESITQGHLGEDVSPKAIISIINTIQANGIQVVYKDLESNENLFKIIQDETNVQVETLHTLEMINPKDYHSYLDMMRFNLEALAKELRHD